MRARGQLDYSVQDPPETLELTPELNLSLTLALTLTVTPNHNPRPDPDPEQTQTQTYTLIHTLTHILTLRTAALRRS